MTNSLQTEPQIPGQLWVGVYFHRFGTSVLPLMVFTGIEPKVEHFLEYYPDINWELHREDEHLMIEQLDLSSFPFIGDPPRKENS